LDKDDFSASDFSVNFRDQNSQTWGFLRFPVPRLARIHLIAGLHHNDDENKPVRDVL
jgi:hypothetical protein